MTSISINDILPPEILLEVFYHATATHGALGLHAVLLACRLWYTLAVNESRLWTCISFDTIFMSRFRRLSSDAARCFGWQCVNRSGRLPISVFINVDALYNRTQHTLHSDHFQTTLASINAVTDIDHFKRSESRLETLVIHQRDRSKNLGADWYHYMLRVCRPQPQRLELHNHRFFVAHRWINSTLSPTTIVYIDPSWVPSPARPRCDVDVPQLVLERCSPWSLDDLRILRVYQALTTLRLLSKPSYSEKSHFHFEQGPDAHDDDLSVALPSVNTLSLTGEIPHQILGALNLPALKTMEIRNHADRHSMGVGHLQNTTLHHNVTKLEVFIACCSHREAHAQAPYSHCCSWTCDLAAVLTATCKLRTIVVSAPMLSHLPRTLVPDTAILVVREN